MHYWPSEYARGTSRESKEQRARNAHTSAEKNGIDALQLKSNETKPSGIAGTAVGQMEQAKVKATDEFLRERGWSRATLAKLDAGFGTAFFPDAKQSLPAVIFHFPKGKKARSIEGKHFCTNKGFELDFWNIERVVAAKPDRIFITEGEPDAVSLVEAGISENQVLSVPNGAKLEAAKDPLEQRGYEYAKRALPKLSFAKEIVWCGDNDAPGLTLREDMVRIFGAARFRFVDWPDGIKDANEMLLKDGAQPLRELVQDGSLPWPVHGIYRLSELPEPPKMTLWRTGFADWGDKVMLAPRTMSVVTGHPGHGKTKLLGQIIFNIVRAECIPACIASFETRPKPHMRQQLRTLLVGKLERDMSDEEKNRADKWINERYLFVVHPEQRPTLEWFLDMAEVAVIRHGARIIQIDPWNRLEASRGKDESETEYIGRALRTIHTFAHDLNCHVQVLAHPAKMGSKRIGDPPHLEDISGSKNWDNMVDQGFVVHRPKMIDDMGNRLTTCDFIQRKSRFEELGYPCVMKLNYSLERGKYETAEQGAAYGVNPA